MSHMDMNAAERQKRHGRAIYGPFARILDWMMRR